MTTPNDFDRTARAWLAGGPTELADRVLDAALSEVHLTQQRRQWAPWRISPMPFPASSLLARTSAALVVGALALGGLLYLIGSRANVGGPGVPSAASANPTSSASNAPSPGMVTIDETTASGYTIVVPSTWVRGTIKGGVLMSATPPMLTLYIWVGRRPTGTTDAYVFDVGNLPGNTETGRNAAELLAWVKADWQKQESVAATNEHQVTVDGEPGVAVEFARSNGFVATEVVIVHGDRAYDLQLSAPAAHLAELRTTLAELLASMRWTS